MYEMKTNLLIEGHVWSWKFLISTFVLAHPAKINFLNITLLSFKDILQNTMASL